MATGRPYLLIVATSMFLAACGGAAHKSTKIVPAATIRAAVRETLAQPEKLEFTASIDLGCVTSSMAGTGAFAPGSKAELHAQVKLPLAGTQPFDEVSVAGVTWVRSPALQNGDRWELANKAPTLGLGLFPFLHPTILVSRLGNRRNPRVIGTDSVGGVETTHYLTQIGEYPAEAWVDAQNQIREIKVTIDATTGKQKVEAKLTMMLSDFGKPVTITSPVST